MNARATVLWLALALFVGTACDVDMGPTLPDASAGRGTCLVIRNCVRDTCGNTPGGDESKECVQRCLAQGSTNAQALYVQLTSCLVNICCTDQAGCGGGTPKCSASGTAACERCTCMSQCAPMNAPCRRAATMCYGLEPDCAACK